ncbi:MAG: hypothetical protein AAFW74_03545, partial [Pseudomonadota bacterium]
RSTDLSHRHQAGTINLSGFHGFMGSDHLVEFKAGANMMAQFASTEQFTDHEAVEAGEVDGACLVAVR